MLLPAVLSLGCATTLYQSSTGQFGTGHSTVVLRHSIDESVSVLEDAFLKRGYQIVDKRPTPSGEIVLRFSGGQLPLTSVRSYGRHFVYGSTEMIGSVFIVELTPVDASTTKVYLFGRPTYNGIEACTQESIAGGAPCDDVILGRYESLFAKNELDTVRSVILSFAPAEVGVDANPPKKIWKCRPSEDPRWKNADPYEKKKMLEACMQS
jgi:hypothetical protein